MGAAYLVKLALNGIDTGRIIPESLAFAAGISRESIPPYPRRQSTSIDQMRKPLCNTLEKGGSVRRLLFWRFIAFSDTPIIMQKPY